MQCGLCFPYWDELHLVPLVERCFDGKITFIDLWAQHNEHRPFFPRILMLALARLTGWNVAYELGMNIVLALGTLLLMVHLARRTAVLANRPMPLWLLPILSFFVFSWAQMENWVWGWQLQVFLCTSAVVAGATILAGGGLLWGRFAAAALLGVVASYSFASGLLYWFAALPVVLSTPGASRQVRAARLMIWAVMALLTYESYFSVYTKPSVSPDLTGFMRIPETIVACAGYIVLYLGGPLTGLAARPAWHGPIPSVQWIVFLPGAAGILCYMLCAYVLLRKRNVSFVAIAPWLAIGAQAVGSALVTCAGRVNAGLGSAVMSRYMTIALLFWCSLAVMIVLASRPSGEDNWRTLVLVTCLVVVGQALFIHQNRHWEDICRWKQMGWQAIRAGDEEPLYLSDLCWDGDAMKTQYLPVMKRLRVCGFDESGPPNPAQAEDYVREAKRFMQEGKWGPAAVYLSTALCFDPNRQDARELLEEAVDTTR